MGSYIYKMLPAAHPQDVPKLRVVVLSANPKTIFLGLHLVISGQNA